MTADERIRAFVALELDERLRAAIAALQDRVKALAGLRLVRPDGVHLTLRFLGSSTQAQLEALAPRLAAAADACPPFEARVEGLGTFPERRAPRVLWLGVELPPSVLELQRACERAARGRLRSRGAAVHAPSHARPLSRARAAPEARPRGPRPDAHRDARALP